MPVSTTARRSEENWISSQENTKSRPKPSDELSNPAKVERALVITFRVVLPSMSRSASSGLGFSSPSYNRAFIRNSELFVELSRELGDWWVRLMKTSQLSDVPARRIDRQHMEDAALELMTFVEDLPEPERVPVVQRSAGVGWRTIYRRYPDRASFSIKEDYDRALRKIWLAREGAVLRLV